MAVVVGGRGEGDTQGGCCSSGESVLDAALGAADVAF